MYVQYEITSFMTKEHVIVHCFLLTLMTGQYITTLFVGLFILLIYLIISHFICLILGLLIQLLANLLGLGASYVFYSNIHAMYINIV